MPIPKEKTVKSKKRILDDDSEDEESDDEDEEEGPPSEGGKGGKRREEGEKGESEEDGMLYGITISLTVFTLAIIPLYALACAIKDIRCPKKAKTKPYKSLYKNQVVGRP